MGLKCLLTKLLGLLFASAKNVSASIFLIHINHSFNPLPFHGEAHFCFSRNSRANILNSDHLAQASVLTSQYGVAETTP